MEAESKRAYKVAEAAELLSISVSQLYRLLEQQEIGSIKIGSCRRISKAQLDAYVKAKEGQSGFLR